MVEIYKFVKMAESRTALTWFDEKNHIYLFAIVLLILSVVFFVVVLVVIIIVITIFFVLVITLIKSYRYQVLKYQKLIVGGSQQSFSHLDRSEPDFTVGCPYGYYVNCRAGWHKNLYVFSAWYL